MNTSRKAKVKPRLLEEKAASLPIVRQMADDGSVHASFECISAEQSLEEFDRVIRLLEISHAETKPTDSHLDSLSHALADWYRYRMAAREVLEISADENPAKSGRRSNR